MTLNSQASIEVSQSKSAEAISIYKGQKSILTMVISESGRGKSFSMFDLPPSETFFINVMGKPLPFMSGLDYIDGENMYKGANFPDIIKHMKAASNNPQYNYIVIDDCQYVMATEFMDKIALKGFDKWNDMAKHIWEILILSSQLRPGLKVFFLTHEDENNNKRHMKTLGRLLEDKITPEGLATIVLFAEVAGPREARKYFFSTQSDGYTTAKSPFDMFPPRIPNNLKLVADRIDEYYSRVPLKDSKLKSKMEV